MSQGYIRVKQEPKKPDYIAMSGQSQKQQKKWLREQLRKIYIEVKK